jgi:hypothetical protein
LKYARFLTGIINAMVTPPSAISSRSVLLMPDMFNDFRLNEAGKSDQDRASVNLDDIFRYGNVPLRLLYLPRAPLRVPKSVHSI